MNDDQLVGYYAPDPMPRWRRWLQQKLFPQQYLAPADEDGDPDFAPGEAMSTHVVTVDWKDRMRLLVSGELKIETRHRFDVPVRRMKSRGQFNVSPPSYLT